LTVLRAAEAEVRVEAPGAIRRVLFPRFAAEAFPGVGPLRALHLLTLSAGATLPARRLANLSVLRLCWMPGEDAGWLLRQDCGAGAELPAWTAPAAVEGVELWVQTRRSNGLVRRHEAAGQPLRTVLAEPGDPGWDAEVRVDGRGNAGRGVNPLWWQLLWGSVAIDGQTLGAGDGCHPLASGLPPMPATAAILCIDGG
jgi:hypothetical protein